MSAPAWGMGLLKENAVYFFWQMVTRGGCVTLIYLSCVRPHQTVEALTYAQGSLILTAPPHTAIHRPLFLPISSRALWVSPLRPSPRLSQLRSMIIHPSRPISYL